MKPDLPSSCRTSAQTKSNKKLRKEYGLDYDSAKGHFIANSTRKGKFNKPGLRTDVLKNNLNLNGFNHENILISCQIALMTKSQITPIAKTDFDLAPN